MSAFKKYTIETAPPESRAGLESAEKAFHFVPNLQAYMAESPALLNSYGAVWEIFATQTGFSPIEQQVVLLTVNFENHCHYCMAGHSALAKMVRMDPLTLNALREGTTIPDDKLEALRVFTKKMVQQRGFLESNDVEAFLAVGYTPANVFDVLTGVALKIVSNYTNHIVDTPLDPFMRGNEWTHPDRR